MRIILLFLTIIALTFSGCELKEGTIVYDIEFPKADSCEAAGTCGGGGGGGGSTPGGPVTTTNPNGSGAGYTVSKTIANVYENGSDNDTFTVVLVKAPTADVFMNITNPDTTEVSVTPTSISFGSGNWSTAQTINLYGVEDGLSDGNLATNLTVSIDNSSDTDYGTGIDNATVVVNSIDSSAVSAITLTASGGSTSVTESGTTDTVTVELSRQPAQNVTVNLGPSDATEFTVSPTSIIFSSGNFSSAQTITLTAIEDNIVDGLQNVNLSTNSTSLDISYDNVSATIAVAVVDSGNAPPSTISDLRAVSGTQLNTITWSKPTGTTSYTLYWSTTSPVSTSSSKFTISSGDTLTYTHAGLTAGTRYYYAIAANNSHGASGLSNEVFGDPTAYSGCNTSGNLIDNDSSLILHYGFNNSLEDIKDVPGNGRYDLSNLSGTIKYAQSCAYGQAAYFDSTTGYLRDNDFDDADHSNLFSSGNFTMAMWFLADADTIEYSSLMSSKNITSGSSDDNGNWSWQLDDDGSNRIRWRSAQGGKVVAPHITHTVASSTYSKNQWYYATFVKHDNGTGQIYIDGALEATSAGTQHSPLQQLKIGINRYGNMNKIWKGYIDEFKVYNRAFDGDDVKNACLLYSQCTGLTPVTPDNFTATAVSSSQIDLSWNPVNGATSYTIHFGTSSGSYTSSTTRTETTWNHTGRSASTTYYYRIRANNSAGASSWATANATTPAAAGFTISSTTATVRESGVRGDMLWTRVLSDFAPGASSSSVEHHLDRNVIDSEMNVISTGKTRRSIIATNLGYDDAMIMKHGPSGELIWQKQFGSSYNDDIVDVAVDSNDNIYVFGHTTQANGGTFDGVTVSKSGSSTYSMLWLLIKYNKDGVRQWITQIDKTGSSSSYGHARAMDIEGSAIYVAGYSNADSVNQVEKYDLNGVKQGSTINLTPSTGASTTPFVNDLDATSSGVYVATSRGNKGKITKLDNNLTSEVWQVQHSGNYEYYAVKGMPNGNIVAYARASGEDGDPRTISIYNSSGSLVTSGAFNQGNTNRINLVGSDDPSNLAVDSTNNILMIQWDAANRNQNYLVKYNSSGNFVNEKKLPPNFMSYAIDIRQNSAGEEYIYLAGKDNSLSHSHSYGEIGYKYLPTYIGRISNNSVSPVSSTPGYAPITIGLATEASGAVYVCPKYNNAYITTGIVSDELAVHPAGPIQTHPTTSNPFYQNSCLRLIKNSSSTIFSTQQLELYAIQDNVTDANQDITLSFEIIATDTTYQSKTVPNVTVTVENASASAPTAPVNLKATASGTSQIDLTWQKPYMTGLGEGVQNYSLFWSTDNSSFTQITGITNDNYTHSGLNPSTTYYYRVVPNNQAGSGPASNLATANTSSARTVTLSGGGGTVTEGDSGSQTVTLTATISATSTQATTVTLSANTTPADAGSVSGTANVDKDWTFGSSTITIPSNSLTGTTTIVIYGDNVDESNEKAYVVVSGVSGGEGAIENGNQTAEVTIADDDTVKLKWSVVSNDVSVDEAGSEITTTTLLLDTQPNGNVVIDASVIDSSELTMITSSPLTYTASNWSNGQNISVRGANDSIDDGDIASQLRITVNTSSTTDTTGYASLAAKNKNITTRDDDTAGFTVTQSSGSTSVTEAGSTDTFTVVLNTEPTGNVVFALTDNDTDNTEISYSPTALTFTSGNWNSAQTVTVTGVDDSIDDDNVTSVITVAINTGSTADSVYDGLSSQTVNTTTVDDDVTRTVTMSRSPTSVTEGDSGLQTITVTATISATSTQATTVNFTSTSVPADAATSSGIANYTKDWTWSSATATIPAGSLSGTASLVIYGDEVDEDTENVYINMSGVSGGQGAIEDGTQSTTVTINDDDNAGMTFRFVGDNATVSETGTISSDIQNTDNLTMKLATRPTGNVVIDLTSSDTGEFTISPSQMTFTTSNWSTDQIMTVTGQTDGIEDGTVQVFARANINTAGTADAKYDALSQDSKAVYVYNVTTLTAPVITAVNAAEQQNQIVWNAYTGATGYKLHYDTNPTVSTSDPYFTIGSSMNAYYHNGLQSGQRVYYRVVATTGSGDSPMSNELSGLPTSFPGCNGSYVVDNDPNLIVHYPFEGNLEDVKDIHGDSRYDMTHVDNGGQALKYSGSCAGGQALYFDSTTGQAVNTQFTNSNVGGQLENDNYTIEFWVVKDGDMVKFSSVINSGLKASHAPTGDWSDKFQFDVGTSGNLRWVSASGTQGSSGGTMTQNQWYHAVGTFLGTQARLYIDGVQRAANAVSSPQDKGFKALMLGVNRSNDTNSRHWKGYLDSLKVFHGAKTQQEIAQMCLSGSTKCNYTPITPTNFAGVGRAKHNVLTWDHGVGVDNYTITWRSSGGFEGSPSVSDSNPSITVSGNSTTYMHMDLTPGYYHYKIKANRTLPDGSVGSSSYSAVVGNVQPTSFILELVQSYNQGICKFQSNLSLVRCRGKNNYNQFNTANTNDVTSPIAVHGLSNVATFTYDFNKMAFLNHDSSYQHEGYDLGYGTQTTPVSNVTNPIQIQHGNNYVLYLLSNGTIRSRGYNAFGQLGDGTTNNVTTGTTTVQVSGITTATKIVAAQYTGCALLSNGQVWCWGNAADGELGQGNKTTSLTPVQVPLPSNTAIDIFSSGRTIGALMSNGTIYAWGNNSGSKIKLTTNTSDVTSPIQLSTRTDLKEADWSTDHVIVRTTGGKIYSGGKIRANSNLTGNATFLASISGSWKYSEGLIEMDDTGFQNRVIAVDGTGMNAFWVTDNLTLYCIGYSGEGQCTNSTSTGGYQTTPLILEGM